MSEQASTLGNECVRGELVEVIIVEIVELEEHARHHHREPAPHARHYAFRVDKSRCVVDHARIEGEAILGKVGKTSAGYKLYQHRRGHQPIQIAPNKTVDLREPGVERFTTMPKDTTEGLETGLPTRAFRLPAADEAYLEGLGLPWETVLESGMRWLILRSWKTPTGYNHSVVSMALLIPDTYADTQIDMVYFHEHLARSDGKAIGGLATQPIQGATWQRWSRHRTGANPWRAGIDDVASHLALVDEWLRREF